MEIQHRFSDGVCDSCHELNNIWLVRLNEPICAMLRRFLQKTKGLCELSPLGFGALHLLSILLLNTIVGVNIVQR